jgi:hypothetical protein
MKRADDDSSAANDDTAPTRLDDLVADAIEDFIMRAEEDIEEGEEPIDAAPALIELAAAAMANAFLSAPNPELTPEDVVRMAAGRMSSMLMAEVERSELLNKPRLAVVKPGDRHGRRAGADDVGIGFEIDEVTFAIDEMEFEDEVAIEVIETEPSELNIPTDFDAAYDALMAEEPA